MGGLIALPLARPALASIGDAIRRLSTPAFSLGIFGGLQVLYLWLLARYLGVWIPSLATVGLVVLLLSLAVPENWRWKSAGLLLLIAVTTVAPAVVSMVIRTHVGITVEHDGLIQTEAAIARLLKGQPIYGVDWSDTEMGRMPWTLTPGRNPALSHNAYFPLTVLAGVPVRLLSDAVGFPFDYRMVLIGFLLIGLKGATALPIPGPGRFMVATAVFLNPVVALYFWSGRNDVSYVAMLLVGLALLARGRVVAAAAAFGAGIALKPFAALTLPFLVLTLWIRWRGRPDLHLREAACTGGALVVVPLLTMAPFFVESPAAFWRDTVLYMNGGLPDAYPIAGFGFGALLLALGVVKNRTDAFPFTVFQLGIMLPVLWIGARALCRRPTLAHWMGAYVGLFLAFGFFGRFFNDNYLGVILALAACIPALGDAPLVAPIRGGGSGPGKASPATARWR